MDLSPCYVADKKVALVVVEEEEEEGGDLPCG